MIHSTSPRGRGAAGLHEFEELNRANDCRRTAGIMLGLAIGMALLGAVSSWLLEDAAPAFIAWGFATCLLAGAVHQGLFARRIMRRRNAALADFADPRAFKTRRK